jgi:hypothetical protein
MTVRYSVSDADPQKERAPLQKIWRENLPISCPTENKYDWFYRQAPHRPDAVFLLTSHSDSGTSVVGCAGFGIRRFWSANQKFSSALMTDLAVDKAHRTLMPALMLARHSQKHVTSDHSFSYGFPNKLAVGVLLRTGYKKLGQSIRYACVLRYENHLLRYLKIPLLARLAGLGPNAARLGLLAARAMPTLLAYRLRFGRSVDSSFDALFDQAKNEYPLVAWRGAEFVRWRFCQHPEYTYEIATLRKQKSQELRAWAAIRTEGPTVFISDVFGHTADLGKLLDLLLTALILRGKKTVSFRYLGSARILGLFLRRGFVARDVDQDIIFAEGKACPVGIGDNPSGWHITDADEDT